MKKKISDQDKKDWKTFIHGDEKLHNKDKLIDKEKKIVSGDPEKIKKVYDTWKFCRSIKSASPNWLLIDTQA